MMTSQAELPIHPIRWLELMGSTTTFSHSANDMLNDCFRMLPRAIKTEVARAKTTKDGHTHILENLFDPATTSNPTFAVPHLTIGSGIGRQLDEAKKRLYRSTRNANSYLGNLRIDPDRPLFDPPDFLLISCPFAGSRTEIETVDVDQLVRTLDPTMATAATNTDFELCIGNRRTTTALLDRSRRRLLFSDDPLVLRGRTHEAAEVLSEISTTAKALATTTVLHAGSIIMINNATTLSRWQSPETGSGKGELLLSWINLQDEEKTCC